MHYIGDPDAQTGYWQHQDLHDNCAVVAQTSIINQYLDHPISQEEATYVAYTNGWYNPGSGTPAEDVGNLFSAYDIPHHSVDHASAFDLASELQQGHRVVVGVNSSELWEEHGPMHDLWNWIIEAFGFNPAQFNPADHAISVTGIDRSDPLHPKVIINDSGVPDGAGKAYPLDQFMEAWKGSDFHYVATNDAPHGTHELPFDLGEMLGIGTTLAATALGADAMTAAQAGELVTTLSHEINWDEILTAV